MRTHVCILLSLFLCACDIATDEESSNEDADKIVSDSTKAIRQVTDSDKNELPVLAKDVIYIGFIEDFYFLDNKEVYVELYFINDNVSTEEYYQAIKLGDSLIFSNDENVRTRIPFEDAYKHFDIRGIDSISIFDKQGKFIETTSLKHIEYLEQNIAPQFIAVFETKRTLDFPGDYYCVGNFNSPIDNSTFHPSENPTLSEKIVSKYDLDQKYVDESYKSIHFIHNGQDSTISCLNSNESTVIVISHKDDISVLYKSNESENITNIIALPIQCNGLPLLLTESLKPESDVSWNSLLAFDGEKYAIQTRQKINIKNCCQQK